MVALYLQSNPGASPATVANALLGNTTTNVVGSPGAGSPNRLLYSLFQQGLGRAAFRRYLNTRNGDHFYTTNWNELGADGGDWIYEMIQCQIYTQP